MIRVERRIDASRDAVWRYLGDLRAWGRLLPTFAEVEPLDERPTGAGSRFRVTQPGLAKAIYLVTAWCPGQSFTWQASMPGVRTTARHDVHEDGTGTRLVLELSWQGPLAPLIRLALGRKARHMVSQEAATFAQLAEADG